MQYAASVFLFILLVPLRARSRTLLTLQMSTEKKKATRKKKDPNAPKRSLSAYMFFANENRDIVRAENPGITFGEVGRMLGDKWKALTDEDKEPYNSKAAVDKKRYEKEKAEYAKRQ